MGWQEGQALGKSMVGALEPLHVKVKTDRKGRRNKVFLFLLYSFAIFDQVLLQCDLLWYGIIN